MANMLQGLAQPLFTVPTLFPQTLANGVTDGVGVDVRYIGPDRLSAELRIGAVNTFTSLNVKIQYSTDNVTFSDISGATFTEVTAANQSPSQVIDFVLPAAATLTAAAPIYVRARATSAGTSVIASCNILGTRKFATSGSSFQASPATVN